jgi:DNA-binding response OmpR family regulator
MPDKTLTPSGILHVSPFKQDHDYLRGIFGGKVEWNLNYASTLRSGLEVATQDQMVVVICEAELPDGDRGGDWRDLLQGLAKLPKPPLLIVVSNLADEKLWGEVLNRGGYDVLMKPFNTIEVRRAVALARLHWDNLGQSKRT